MNRKSISSTLLILILVSTSMVGCFGTIEPEIDSKTIRVLTYDVYALSEEMISQFEEESGYNVVFTKVGDGGEVLETALRTQDLPAADVIIGIDNSFLQTALDHSLFQKHDVTLSELHPQALEPYDGKMAIPFDWGRVCINVDAEYADGENVSMPENLWDFTNEEWKGKLAVQNPRSSTPGRAFLAATVDYFENDADPDTDYTDWWKAVSENDMIVTSGWSESYLNHYEAGYGIWEDSFIGGAHAVVSYCHSPGAEAYWGGGETNSVALNISGASFLQVEYAGIAAGPAVNVEGANAFMQFLLSPELQETIPDTNVMYPVSSQYSLPLGPYTNHTAIPAADADMNLQRLGSEMEDWLSAWDEAMA